MKSCKLFCKVWKKVIAAACMVCLLVTLSMQVVGAEGTYIGASSCTLERGSSGSVSVTISGNPGIWSLKLYIKYDHSALKLNSVTGGGVFDGSELTLSNSLDKDPYVVLATANALKNKTGDGTIVTMNFTAKSDTSAGKYSVSVEVVQVINVAGKIIGASGGSGTVTVLECAHTDKKWHTTTAAGCETKGTEELVCTKCGITLETRSIDATKHKNTVVRDAVAATTKSKGYSGDTYCADCGKLLAKGTATEKLSAPISAPKITKGNKLVFDKENPKALTFTSDADFSEFIGVKIDGVTLNAKYYTAKSGSTVITLNKDYLDTLSDGNHTIGIVSKSGTATAQFTISPRTTEKPVVDETVATESEVPDDEKEESEVPADEITETEEIHPITDTENNSNTSRVIVGAVICVIFLVGIGVAVVMLIRKKKFTGHYWRH